MTELDEAETAVRNYLLFRADPSALIDEAEVARLESAASKSVDPIEKLKAIGALQRARLIDSAPLEQAFVLHAKSWATHNDVPSSAFEELGVPEEVLRAAGLSQSRGRRKTAVSVSATTRSTTAKDIQTFILAMPKRSFTLADIAAGAGGSPMTIRKAVSELESSGKVARLGPATDWPGPGRAPIRYQHK